MEIRSIIDRHDERTGKTGKTEGCSELLIVDNKRNKRSDTREGEREREQCTEGYARVKNWYAEHRRHRSAF